MVFTYEAYNRDGEKVFGTFPAERKEEAALALYQKGLIVSSITPVREKHSGGVKEEELITFTRLLSNAVEAHIPLARGLEITIDELSSRSRLKAVATSILHELKVGKSVTEAFQLFPEVFSRFYVSMLKAGEKSGKLAHAFGEVLHYLIKRYEMKKKISSAALYPSFILGFAVIILFFFITVLIPRFQESYAGFGSELPALTMALVNLANFIKQYIIFLVIGIAGLAAGLVRLVRTNAGRVVYEKILFSIPIAGQIIQKDLVSRFTRTVSVLLNGGVTLSEALELVRGVVNNRNYEAVIQEAIFSLSEGRTFSSALKDRPFLPPVLVQMVAMGEESGRLPELLSHLAEFYEKDVDVAVEKITSVITPIMIMFLGIIIGVIVVGLFLPIFNISKMIQQ